MTDEEFLLSEYGSNLPTRLKLGGEELIVPASYKGDINAFTDDLTSFQNNEYKKYERHNEKNPDNSIEPVDIISDKGLHVIVPLSYAKKDIFDENGVIKEESKEEILEQFYKKARKRYFGAVRKTRRYKREYPNKQITTSLSNQHLSECRETHKLYIKAQVLHYVGKITKAVAKATKWTSKEAVNIAVGTAASPLALVYKFMDKKHRIAKSSKKKWIDEKALPYIKRGVLKAMVVAMSYGGIKVHSVYDKYQEKKAKIEQQKTTDNNKKTALSQKYKITDEQSFKQLYDAAFPVIIESMLPTEVLVNKGYADNGKNVNNTVGLGSFWMPKNGDPTCSEWIKTKDYLSKHPDFSVTGAEACILADGWFRHREMGRVYKNMFNLLNGCELDVCEFAAIATCMYNDETNGRKLCRFVKENHNDPLKCAAYLMNLKPSNSSYNDGILKRHTHEALLYLNYDDYANKMGMFLVKEGINSKGNKYYVTSVTQLSVKQCEAMKIGLENGRTKEMQQTSQCICNYVCKGGKTVDQIAQENGIDTYYKERAINFSIAYTRKNANNMYEKALTAYNNKNYAEARDNFKAMIAAGYNGADIHNDLAITHYHLKEYKECIAECNEVLKTEEVEQYSPANYNAGKAYEALGNLSKAKQNYQLAADRTPENPAYNNALIKVTNLIKNVNNKIR